MTSDDPKAMLEHLRIRHEPGGYDAVSDRKLRLFACACCRNRAHGKVSRFGQKWHRDLLSACSIAEEFADGKGQLPPWRGEIDPKPDNETCWVVHSPVALEAAQKAISTDHAVAEAAILRDIIGNPWRPVQLPFVSDPCGKCGGDGGWWMSYPDEMYQADVLSRWRECSDCYGSGHTARHCPWLTPTVLNIAQTIYDTQDFGLMPFLADALEDAGCDNMEILNHCRGREMVLPASTETVYQPIRLTLCPHCGGKLKEHDYDKGHAKWCERCWAVIRPDFDQIEIPAQWRQIVHARGCHVVDLLMDSA